MFNDNNSKNNEDMVPDEEESQKSIKSFLYVDDDERNQINKNQIPHQKIENNINFSEFNQI